MTNATGRGWTPRQRDIVVFDLGAVLIDWDPRHLYRKIFSDEQEMEYFLAEVCSPSWNRRMDAGEPFDHTVAELQRQYPDYADMIAIYRDRWDEMLGGPIEGTVDVLESLASLRTPLYALTNWSAETFPIATSRYDFLRHFQGIVVSGEEKFTKPDPAIYRRLLQRYGFPAERAIFIDDSPANVEIAGRLGFDAIAFTEAGALADSLAERGFSIGAPRR